MFGRRLINTAVGGAIPTDTFAFYELDSNVLDSSGNGYNGTATDITYAAGNFNDAAVFNGTSSNIDTTIDTELQTSVFSFSIWFKSTTTDSTIRHPLARYGESSNAVFYVRHTGNNGDLEIQYYATGGNYQEIFSGVSSNSWQNLTVSLDGADINTYINGVLTTPSSSTGTMAAVRASTSVPILIGKLNLYSIYNFEGQIQKVRIYDYALDAAAALAIYNN
jgi:hypothetical protein